MTVRSHLCHSSPLQHYHRRERIVNDDFLKNLPKYDEPPVVETVLGVQFAPLPGFSAAHAGWFWRTYLGDDWPTVSEAAPLVEAYERFGGERQWRPKGVMQISGERQPPRLQFVSRDDERMVQLQGDRLHYNWRKREEGYPSYQQLLPVFLSTLKDYITFCEDANLGKILPNQWEITYVNHIPQGELWESGTDWSKLFPGFYRPAQGIAQLHFENGGANWHFVIGDNLGRLHIQLEHGRLGAPTASEAILLTLTARGPVDLDKGQELGRGLDFGHASIVRAFTEMTAPNAHKVWERTK